MFYDVFEYALGLTSIINCKDKQQTTGPYFGVFVGVTRSNKHKIPTWPEDIHGSIGYWDKDFLQVDSLQLCKHTYRVAYDAIFKDDRRKYFPDLFTDVDAELDIKFMQLPIREIDLSSGKFLDNNTLFTNNDMGLIAQSATARATYLPGVFIDTMWDDIKESLISKAGAKSNSRLRFYGYTTKRVVVTMRQLYHHIIKTKPLLLFNKLGCQFLSFIDNSRITHVPYSVTKSKQIVYDETQDVRNIGTLLDIKQMAKMLQCPLKSGVIHTLHAEAMYYLDKYMKNPEDLRQASAFLLMLLHNEPVDINSDKLFRRETEMIKRRLYSDVKQNRLEPEFEMGEVLIALNYVSPSLVPPKVFKQFRVPQSIFELNWQAQSFLSLQKQKKIDLSKQLDHYISEFTNHTETNYLAVAFEAATALQNEHVPDLFCDLIVRYDASRGLFIFLDGSSRIDISGHVYRGFMNLLLFFD